MGSETGDNELQITLIRVKSSLKKAVSNNNGNPVSFHKFAIDPFSLTYTVENLFHLASLVKDGLVRIETTPGYGVLLNNILLCRMMNPLVYFPNIYKIISIYYLFT